ncbi:glycoside hydrolase family 99-like domain-containing protein [Caballeronia concitans]|jgi:hypothetical protein|uniref:Lipopolysaccharide biosynthesis protein-like protein n=1 Tax=Caballeronia concitans TaxID=1777133 RepID=A0A658R0V3_9BURK|nr:glycoside hydrolase family 99-like domain-containing protein [Caballeronia concitans]SAL38243.1 lipopolysaccharide biosynthesis protein-like protein [Caballeronia concitans]
MMKCAFCWAVALFSALLLSTACADDNVVKRDNVGVYYYPGWKHSPPLVNDHPWDAIRKYGGREPLLGWYDEGSVDVATRQLQWMHDYGIDFVIYDWYWVNEGGAALTQAIDAYLKSPARSSVKFSILWANHTDTPSSVEQFDAIVDYWIAHYFGQASYYRVNGMPVVFIFAPYDLQGKASSFGTDVSQLFERAREKAVQAGLPGIYFVATSQAVAGPVEQDLPDMGYAAISAYNYHFGLDGSWSRNTPLSHSYAELAGGYRKSWMWILAHSKLPYFVPVTSGWDKRPWGGSPDRLHDMSYGTPGEFGEHLRQAQAVLDQYPEKTLRTVVICCWNEFGEGSYIEPTRKWGFDYLKQIRTSSTQVRRENSTARDGHVPIAGTTSP